MSHSNALTIWIAFWWWLQRQTVCVPAEPTVTHHFGRRLQNLENPIDKSGFFALNDVCNSLRLHRSHISTGADIIFFAWHKSWILIILVKLLGCVQYLVTETFALLWTWFSKNSTTLFQLTSSSHKIHWKIQQHIFWTRGLVSKLYDPLFWGCLYISFKRYKRLS